MTNRRLDDLHTQLADLYRQFPYVTLRNTHTENLWREIERLEEEVNS